MSPKPQDLVIDVEENKSSKDINVVDVENEKKKDRKIINKPLPFHKLLSYTDAVDWSLMPLGTSGSIIHGTAQLIGDLLLGKALNAFGSNIGDDAAMVKALDNVCYSVRVVHGHRYLSAGILVALLSLLVVPMILVIGATYTKKMNTVSTVKLLYLSEATSMVEQTVSQIKTVFAFVGESYAIKTFSESMAKQLSKSKVEALIKGVVIGTFQTVTFCSWALIIWVAAVVVTAKRAHGGDVLAAIMSILLGVISLTFAAPDMQIFNQTKAAGNEVFEVIQRKPLITNDSKGKTLNRMDGNIDIRDVHFAYIPIPAGRTDTQGIFFVNSIWKNGCVGEILIDNHNIKDLDLKFLRRNVGAVSQEPSLFAGTIKDNLIVGNMGADDQEVENAAMMANAHPFISQLPNQYSTEVGQRGFQLSGGQKQRIAIARAILKNPPILLLDEATRALDSESEKLVQDALEKAMQGRTVILIAHRMSTMIHADMIAIVENGQVIETGTHRSLLETSKVYGKLFSMQNISTANNSRLVGPSSFIINSVTERV
ncbi:ABC transporter B family member 19-like [Populus alba]|uniref:ABC transporter B family member 19-like n=1 Tax=Populus alba TaxID=43335 RepID=UPI003CC719B4